MWARLADEHGLSGDLDRFLPHAEPCFVVARLEAGAGAIGASRLGGVPDLPSSLAWPTREREHLTFVAQIDLSTLAPGWIADLPASGWLYFFLGRDEPAFDVTHEVLHFDGPREALSPSVAPPGTSAIADASPTDLAPHVVTFRPSFVLDPKTERALGLEEFSLEALTETGTQLGGLPVSWAPDPRTSAYLLRTGLAALHHRLHHSPEELAKAAKAAWADANDALAEELERATELSRAYRADEAMHRARAKEWRTLFVVRSHREVGMCWWDAGYLQVLVHDADLRARRFDRTYCCVASS